MKKRLLLVMALFIHLSTLTSFATTYYVSTTGSDSNGCTAAQNISTPKQSIVNFLANCSLAAGDTLYIRGGTYAYAQAITLSGLTGTSGSYITISSYPAETAIIRPTAGNALNVGSGH